MSRRYHKKHRKLEKKRDRAIRQSHRRAKNLQLKYGVGNLYFLYLGTNLYGFSIHQRDTAYIKDTERLKECLFGNIPIKNMDTGEIYPNFEEYKKEKLIIKLAQI
jgi:hypothetical protein